MKLYFTSADPGAFISSNGRQWRQNVWRKERLAQVKGGHSVVIIYCRLYVHFLYNIIYIYINIFWIYFSLLFFMVDYIPLFYFLNQNTQIWLYKIYKQI